MKKIYTTLCVLVALAACTKPAQAPQMVVQEDCDKLYDHIQSLAYIEFVDPKLELSKSDAEGAKWEINEQWEGDGTKDKFFLLCPQMTKKEMACAMWATHFSEITNCVRLNRVHP